MFQATKIIDGFSTCFRQEASAPIHCSKLHGYSISFEVVFQGELDHRQWTADFGLLKRSKTSITWPIDNFDNTQGYKEFTADEWFKYMFDHSVIISEDDSQLEWFKQGHINNTLSLRILPHVGCERFAELVFNVMNAFIKEETRNRVCVVSVKCAEHSKNSATFIG